MFKNSLKIFLILVLLISCKEKKSLKKEKQKVNIKTLSDAAVKVRNGIKKDAVIAHRGTTYWAPEQTEPAYRWARNMGADYLEFDIQMTKDSMLVLYHDKKLKKTTDVATIFPDRIEQGIHDFTLKELRSLDLGSWFNKENPNRAKESFKNLKMMTLEDIIKIVEGYRVKTQNGKPVQRLENGKWNGHYEHEKDPNDNGNRPGLYLETKRPKLNLEKVLVKKLTSLGWNINSNPKVIKTGKGKVKVANSRARLVFLSFSTNSIEILDKIIPNVPKCLLLWRPKMEEDLKNNYKKALEFAVANNVQIIGASIAGEPNNYGELNTQWMTDLVHQYGLLVHPYTFDTQKQIDEYKNRVDGINGNRTDLFLKHYNRLDKTAEETLTLLGYK